ncbi:hypothetical protein L7F22_010902 [Adiantum nelumboides]|nr:hypothetical protein [Adiantum nelumboides]
MRQMVVAGASSTGETYADDVASGAGGPSKSRATSETGAASKRLAIRILSHDCSSGPCERNWSTWALFHTKKRNRLSTAQLERLVYCHCNLRLLDHTASSPEPRQVNVDKIDIEKVKDIPDIPREELDIYPMLYEEMSAPAHQTRASSGRSRSARGGASTSAAIPSRSSLGSADEGGDSETDAASASASGTGQASRFKMKIKSEVTSVSCMAIANCQLPLASAQGPCKQFLKSLNVLTSDTIKFQFKDKEVLATPSNISTSGTYSIEQQNVNWQSMSTMEIKEQLKEILRDLQELMKQVDNLCERMQRSKRSKAVRDSISPTRYVRPTPPIKDLATNSKAKIYEKQNQKSWFSIRPVKLEDFDEVLYMMSKTSSSRKASASKRLPVFPYSTRSPTSKDIQRWADESSDEDLPMRRICGKQGHHNPESNKDGETIANPIKMEAQSPRLILRDDMKGLCFKDPAMMEIDIATIDKRKHEEWDQLNAIRRRKVLGIYHSPTESDEELKVDDEEIIPINNSIEAGEIYALPRATMNTVKEEEETATDKRRTKIGNLPLWNIDDLTPPEIENIFHEMFGYFLTLVNNQGVSVIQAINHITHGIIDDLSYWWESLYMKLKRTIG